MKVQFYFKTNNDYVSFVERATGRKLGNFQIGEEEALCLLRCSGKPVRLSRSQRGHVMLYFDAYDGSSLELVIETGSVVLTSNTLREALEIRDQFPQLLTPAHGQKLEITETGNNIPAPVVEIIGGKEYPRATPVAPASAPLLRMIGITDFAGEQKPDEVSSRDSKRKKDA